MGCSGVGGEIWLVKLLAKVGEYLERTTVERPAAQFLLTRVDLIMLSAHILPFQVLHSTFPSII